MPTPAVEEMEWRLGRELKRYRLQLNEEQRSLAQRAGVSVRALGNLENGVGSSLTTLVRVVIALGGEDWLDSLVPHAAQEARPSRRSALRQRARRSPCA